MQDRNYYHRRNTSPEQEMDNSTHKTPASTEHLKKILKYLGKKIKGKLSNDLFFSC